MDPPLQTVSFDSGIMLFLRTGGSVEGANCHHQWQGGWETNTYVHIHAIITHSPLPHLAHNSTVDWAGREEHRLTSTSPHSPLWMVSFGLRNIQYPEFESRACRARAFLDPPRPCPRSRPFMHVAAVLHRACA